MADAIDANDEQESKKIRVLLVDDQQSILDMLSAIIRSEPDMEYRSCTSALEAFQIIEQFQPTVILHDLMMPSIDGIESVRKIRAHQAYADIPIVILSSRDSPETKVTAFETGANDYLVKFPNPIELIARVRYHSDAYIAHRELNKTIAKLEEAHNQLLQSEKMASIGQLASGVAHEINNPIGYVASNVSSLRDYIKDLFTLIDAFEETVTSHCDDDKALQALQTVKESVELDYIREDSLQVIAECKEGLSRVKKIVADLKDFSRVDQPDWQSSNLHEGIESTLNIAWNEIKYKAEVIKEYGNIPDIECIPSQLNQVFMNLLVNGAQAISERGTITIRSGCGNNIHDVDSQNDCPSSSGVWLQFIDSGHGIDPQVQKKIFNPFFTTKPVGQGTGLGLSLSYSIINRHKGKIEVSSEQDKGSCFTIWLPKVQPEDHGIIR